MATPKIDLSFITDEALQENLAMDLKELESALANGSHKAALILAGSVAEAVLVDHIIALNIAQPAAAYKLTLDEAIAKCHGAGALSQRTADLCSVIRSYRNLIHPGRVVRTQDAATPESATVAQSLVSIIVRELSEKRTKSTGPSAEQIVQKLNRDSTVLSILPHLLRDMRPAQLEKLLIKSLPDELSVLDLVGDGPPHLRDALGRCFRQALSICDTDMKKRVCHRFVAVLREADEAYVSAYCEVFFQASDMEAFSQSDREMVLDHLMGRLKADPSATTLRIMNGIAKVITADKAREIMDQVSRVLLQRRERTDDADAMSFFWTFSDDANAEVLDAAKKRLDVLAENAERHGHNERAERYKHFRIWLDGLPF